MLTVRVHPSLLRSSVLAALLALPACNIVVLGDDTEGGSTTSATDMTTSGAPTGGGMEESGNVPTTGDPTGDVECDFAGAVQPIFTASCSCHGGPQPAQGLSLVEGSVYARQLRRGLNDGQRGDAEQGKDLHRGH